MSATTPSAHGDASAIADIELLDLSGDPVRIGSLWEGGPVVLVWLRHYG